MATKICTPNRWPLSARRTSHDPPASIRHGSSTRQYKQSHSLRARLRCSCRNPNNWGPYLLNYVASIYARALKSNRQTLPLSAAIRKSKMNPSITNHAATRQQQRGIPPLVFDWLMSFGYEQFDGHGGVVRYFTKRCIRQLEREVGRQPVARMSEYLRCYLVQSSKDGAVITVGKRHPNQHIYKH